MSSPYINGFGTVYFGTTAQIAGMVTEDIGYDYKNNINVKLMDENGRVITEYQDDLWKTIDVNATLASGSFYTPGQTFTVSSSYAGIGALTFILQSTKIKTVNKDYVKMTMNGINYQYVNSGSL